MLRLKAVSLFFCSLALFLTTLAPFAKADEPKIHLEETNLPTQIVRDLYPAVPFFVAKVYLDARGWADTGANKFAGYVILASAFHAAGEIPKLLVESGLVKDGSVAQSLSSFAMFIPAYLMDAAKSPLSGNFFAAGTNQLGHGFRHVVKENHESLKSLAVNLNATEHTREHIHEIAKTTGSTLALTAIGFLKSGHGIASFTDKVAASGSFTGAYVLREALLEHFRHLQVAQPEIDTAALLSFVGMLGTVLTTPGQMPAIISEALLEAGFYTGVDFALTKERDLIKTSVTNRVISLAKEYFGYEVARAKAEYALTTASTYAVAGLGVALWIPSIYANSVRARIQNTLASAMILPAAFTTLDLVKDQFSHLYYK